MTNTDSAVKGFDFLELNQILAGLMVRETALELMTDVARGDDLDTIRQALAICRRAKARALTLLIGEPPAGMDATAREAEDRQRTSRLLRQTSEAYDRRNGSTGGVQ